MAVNVNNIIIGPCKSLKIGVKGGSLSDVGGTSGGVQVAKKRDYVNVEVDQYAATMKKSIKHESYTIKTTLSEATLKNLAYAWDNPQPTTLVGPPSQTSLGMGIVGDMTPTEYELEFVGPAPSGATRTFTIHRAISMGSATPTMDKNKETVYAVEFECLPDLSATAGEEFGTVVDQ